MELNKFIDENCKYCGSQRCDPRNLEWLNGCKIYQEKKEHYMKDRYKYYSDGGNKIVAVSSYAGKSVRGVAKCNPNDSFSEDIGKQLAKARCDYKVAEKRLSRAEKKRSEAAKNLSAAFAIFEQMNSYFSDAAFEVDEAKRELDSIVKSLQEG